MTPEPRPWPLSVVTFTETTEGIAFAATASAVEAEVSLDVMLMVPLLELEPPEETAEPVEADGPPMTPVRNRTRTTASVATRPERAPATIDLATPFLLLLSLPGLLPLPPAAPEACTGCGCCTVWPAWELGWLPVST